MTDPLNFNFHGESGIKTESIMTKSDRDNVPIGMQCRIGQEGEMVIPIRNSVRRDGGKKSQNSCKKTDNTAIMSIILKSHRCKLQIHQLEQLK